jgi:CheY-like chemotaxis protein
LFWVIGRKAQQVPPSSIWDDLSGCVGLGASPLRMLSELTRQSAIGLTEGLRGNGVRECRRPHRSQSIPSRIGCLGGGGETDRTAGDSTGVDGRADCEGGGGSSRGGAVFVSRILVVDDEPDLRFILRRIFEKAGHEVTDAGDGAAALECVRRSPPELVVMDMMMPVMNGQELIRRLRADPATAQIAILAVSGNGELAGAADALLPKPYRPDQILAVANSLLASEGDGT